MYRYVRLVKGRCDEQEKIVNKKSPIRKREKKKSIHRSTEEEPLK